MVNATLTEKMTPIGKHQMLKLVNRLPTIMRALQPTDDFLGTSVKLTKTLQSGMGALNSQLDASDVLKAVRRNPDMLRTSKHKLKRNTKTLIEKFGTKEGALNGIMRNSEIVNANEAGLTEVAPWLVEQLGGTEMAMTALCRRPELVKTTGPAIRQVVTTLLDMFGGRKDDVMWIILQNLAPPVIDVVGRPWQQERFQGTYRRMPGVRIMNRMCYKKDDWDVYLCVNTDKKWHFVNRPTEEIPSEKALAEGAFHAFCLDEVASADQITNNWQVWDGKKYFDEPKMFIEPPPNPCPLLLMTPPALLRKANSILKESLGACWVTKVASGPLYDIIGDLKRGDSFFPDNDLTVKTLGDFTPAKGYLYLQTRNEHRGIPAEEVQCELQAWSPITVILVYFGRTGGASVEELTATLEEKRAAIEETKKPDQESLDEITALEGDLEAALAKDPAAVRPWLDEDGWVKLNKGTPPKLSRFKAIEVRSKDFPPGKVVIPGNVQGPGPPLTFIQPSAYVFGAVNDKVCYPVRRECDAGMPLFNDHPEATFHSLGEFVSYRGYQNLQTSLNDRNTKATITQFNVFLSEPMTMYLIFLNDGTMTGKHPAQTCQWILQERWQKRDFKSVPNVHGYPIVEIRTRLLPKGEHAIRGMAGWPLMAFLRADPAAGREDAARGVISKQPSLLAHDRHLRHIVAKMRRAFGDVEENIYEHSFSFFLKYIILIQNRIEFVNFDPKF